MSDKDTPSNLNDEINAAMGKTGGFIVYGGEGISYVVRNRKENYDDQFPGCDI